MARITRLVAEGKFYKSGCWQNKRRQILERDNHECQHCKTEGKFSLATCLPHINH